MIEIIFRKWTLLHSFNVEPQAIEALLFKWDSRFSQKSSHFIETWAFDLLFIVNHAFTHFVIIECLFILMRTKSDIFDIPLKFWISIVWNCKPQLFHVFNLRFSSHSNWAYWFLDLNFSCFKPEIFDAFNLTFSTILSWNF